MSYLVRRLAFAVLLVFVVSSGALLLTRLAPGDITAEMLGAGASRETVARERARYGLDRPLACGIGEHQRVVADLVDQARDPVRGPIRGVARFRRKKLLARSTHPGDFRTDIALGLAAVERLQVAPGGQPLAERFQLGAGEPLLEDRSSGQHQPNPRLPGRHQVGEHADLVQQPHG